MVFTRLDRSELTADFGGRAITSDAGALLLGATDKAINLVDRFAACFTDCRMADRVVHDVRTLIAQRVSASRSATRISTTTTICAAIQCSDRFWGSWMRAGPAAPRWPARAS
jgi:hypothetical protein